MPRLARTALMPLRPVVPGARQDDPDHAHFPILRALVVLALGTLAGIGATYACLEARFDPGRVRSGAWSNWPRMGTSEIDPYARAIFARTGEVPPPAAEANLFFASEDDDGRRLSRRCAYTMSGGLPPARFWTLSATSDAGSPLANKASRYGLSSMEVVRRVDGSFTLDISPTARPGNWLPLSGDGPFFLMLRLYDPLMSLPGSAKARLPSIARRTCATP